MEFGSLPQFPSGDEDRSPARGPLPDRRSAEFVAWMLVVVAAGFVVLFVFMVFAMMLMGAGIGFAPMA